MLAGIRWTKAKQREHCVRLGERLHKLPCTLSLLPKLISSQSLAFLRISNLFPGSMRKRFKWSAGASPQANTPHLLPIFSSGPQFLFCISSLFSVLIWHILVLWKKLSIALCFLATKSLHISSLLNFPHPKSPRNLLYWLMRCN